MRILLVEDSRPLARSVAEGLSEEGFTMDVAHDGDDGLHLGSEIAYDAIILDRMLPGMDGLEVLRRLRERNVRTPVLLLTALGEVHHRVEGLDVGADDYLVKPFAFDELLARLRALVRRSRGRARNALELGRLRVDLASRTAAVDGRALELSAKEFGVLAVLALEPDTTFTRSELAARLYDEESDRDSNVIDVFVARIRRKLDGAGLRGAEVVRTQRGAGYRLDPAAAGGTPG
jgi:two-component system OmpR family response regulator